MGTWSPNLHIATWTVMSLLGVFSHEVTVKNSALKLCKEDDTVCVTDLRDCGPAPPSSIQKTVNMSCYYQTSHRSMTCELSEESNSHTEPDVSLIFSSRNKIYSCYAMFNPAAVVNVTARIKNYMTGRDIRSQPHTVVLYKAVKPSQPVLTVLHSTDDSVVVSWRSSSSSRSSSCRLRYRVNNSQTWSQPPDFDPVYRGQTLVYTIADLLPFTVYRAAVACREESDIWSAWSPEVTVRTLDRVPSRPPEVCYRVEKTNSGGSPLLHLTWKALDPREAGGRVLGYKVSYKPVKKQGAQERLIQNFTGEMALLVVEEGNCSVTVAAFNMAGHGPAAHLSIDTQRQNNLPSVRNLWVSSFFPAIKGLVVQWEMPTAPPSALPVSHFDVQWHSETRPSTSGWSTVDGFTTSTVIEDVDPDESYLISVFPIYKRQCGAPQSLAASLQSGALMEAVKLKLVGVTRTSVTVVGMWQRKSGTIRVNRYSVMLKKSSEKQKTLLSFPTVSLWPDPQWQHTFPNLTPDTDYSLFLLADNETTNIISVRTDFDNVPVVATAVTLLLLAVAVLIIGILSRTVYKSYFFPPISSPWGSTTGQWLMDPNHQKSTKRHILDIKDFQVMDILGEKSVIVVRPNSVLSTEEDVHEETSLLPPHLVIKLSALKLNTEYVSDVPLTAEHQLQSCPPDRTVNCHHIDRVFMSEEHREAHAALMHHVANTWFNQKGEEKRELHLTQITSHQTETAVKCDFQELMANTDSLCVYQMTCEAEYVLSTSFQGKPDVETVTGQTDSSHLICDTDYIANSRFPVKCTDEDIGIAC